MSFRPRDQPSISAAEKWLRRRRVWQPLHKQTDSWTGVAGQPRHRERMLDFEHLAGSVSYLLVQRSIWGLCADMEVARGPNRPAVLELWQPLVFGDLQYGCQPGL